MYLPLRRYAVSILLFGFMSVSYGQSMSLQESVDSSRQYLVQNRQSLNLTEQDIQDARIQDAYVTQHNGITHLVWRQYIYGIEVKAGDMQINLTKDGDVLTIHNQFMFDARAKINTTQDQVRPDHAVLSAADYLNIDTYLPPVAIQQSRGVNQAVVFRGDEISGVDIPVKLVYQKMPDGSLNLAWDLSIQTPDNWWSLRVDAQTNQVIDQVSWQAHASYEVLPLPYESPTAVGAAFSVVTDPADSVASSYGWHDTNGVVGAEYTDTRGNNVFAQEDRDDNNSGGFRPDGGIGLDFLYTWDGQLEPTDGENMEAAIVNLFYWNNIIHDVMHHYGFDEVAGNFQENNYGNGGSAGDAVNADALDGSGTNNANFSTPPDGQNPRMQMYVFTARAGLTVNSPAAIAGFYTAAPAGFGATLDGAGITGDIELVDDGTVNGSEGCNPLVGFTPGNIAFIDRGSCEFGTKALNAENAGASAVIVANNQDGDEVITMGAGAQGNQVNIAAVMISQNNGAILKNQAGTVNGTLGKDGVDRDGDFDNGIIIHEYGHGISNRLTGGPNNTSCLWNAEQMGEGWSEFFALVMTAQAGDQANDARAMGYFATQNPNGIRTYPYSRDMNINPHTFADVADFDFGSGNVSPHGVGSIWTVMLWDMYWNLVDKYGFDADIYQGTGGNNLALQLVIDGLKLQPCSPGFETGRDAILAADSANNGGANHCEIWSAFAKRGLGEGASSGSSGSLGDEVESYQVPADVCAAPNDLIFENGFDGGS
ncbi:MAG: M36 family metallopeptidase [Marinicella pacifica]